MSKSRPELTDGERRAILDRCLAMWRVTSAKLDAGTLTKAEWLEHLKAENALAEEEPALDLEAILLQGIKLGFVKDVAEAMAMLAPPAAGRA